LHVDGSFSFKKPAVVTVEGPNGAERLPDSDPDRFNYRLTSKGLYTFTAAAEGPDGKLYRNSAVVMAYSPARIDSLLRSKWTALNKALQNGDIDEALKYVEPSRRDSFRIFLLVSKPSGHRRSLHIKASDWLPLGTIPPNMIWKFLIRTAGPHIIVSSS
jgi:hypothetical protein